MEEKYSLNLERGDLYLDMEEPLKVDGNIRIRQHVKTNDGYELVTRDGELRYLNKSEPMLVGRLGGRPFRISMSEEFAEEFEKKEFDVVISGNDKAKDIIEKHTDIRVERPEMFSEKIYSGTEVRRRINSGEEWRYLTPECSHEVLEGLLEKIKNSGTQYNFEPGWKKENSFHGTAEK